MSAEQKTVLGVALAMRHGVIPPHRHDRELLNFFADQLMEARKHETEVGLGNCAAMRHAIMVAVSDLSSNLKMTPGERQFMVRYLHASLTKSPRNCDRLQGDFQLLNEEWFNWTGTPDGQNADGTVKLSFPEWLLAAITKGGAQ